MTAVAVGLGVLSGAVGLTVSQLANVSAGAAIVLVACLAFAASWIGAPRPGAVARLRMRPGTVGSATVDRVVRSREGAR